MFHEHLDHNNTALHSEHQIPNTINTSFKIAVALNLAIVLVEAFYGLLSHSVSLIADSGHNLSDVLGLVLAWGANALATREPTKTRTYGFRRTTILAALFNAIILLIAIGAILWEAILRLTHPSPVEGSTMIWVAALAMLLNGASAWLFVKGKDRDINVRGAFLHMLSDAAVSAGVLVAGVLMLLTQAYWIDPVMSILISIVITLGTWRLLRESFNLAVDAVPDHIDLKSVEFFLRGCDLVIDVHDLHVWAMSTTHSALTAHLVFSEFRPDAVAKVCKELRTKFGIEHATLQSEIPGGPPCYLAPDEII
jgi:cobalt-zinc-cadmium efflux system protein